MHSSYTHIGKAKSVIVKSKKCQIMCGNKVKNDVFDYMKNDCQQENVKQLLLK